MKELKYGSLQGYNFPLCSVGGRIFSSLFFRAFRLTTFGGVPMKSVSTVECGQTWRRPEGSRLVITRQRHDGVPSSHNLREGLVEIQTIHGDGPDGLLLGPVSRVRAENVPKFYTYEGMRWPHRLDVFERRSSDTGGLFLLYGICYQHDRIKGIWFEDYSPHDQKRFDFGKYDARRFWKEYRCVGHISDEEYEGMHFAGFRAL